MFRPDWKTSSSKRSIDLSGNVHYDSITVNYVKEILTFSDIHDYPEESTLYRAIGKYYKTNIENIAVGHGSTEILERVIRLYSDKIIYIVSPTFAMIRVYCEIYNVKYKIITDDDVFSIKDTNGVLYIANPNGLTGKTVEQLPVENYHKIVLDAVYEHFSNITIDSPDIVKIYSISKSLGLAGLRIGWAFSDINTTYQLQNIRSNYITNSAAAAVLPEIISSIPSVVERMLEAKAVLESKYECISCCGNFVLFRKQNELTNRFGFRHTPDGFFRMALADVGTLNV